MQSVNANPPQLRPRHRPGGVRELLGIALPMVVSHGCDTVMTFTDRLFLSRLGPEQMNAAMAGGLTCFMLTTFFLGLVGYSTALVAQYLGAGQPHRCAAATAQAILICLIAWPLIVAARPLIHLLFEMARVPSEQIGPQRAYFDILVLAAGVGLLRHALSSFFSGIGRTRMVMLSAISAMVINIGLNYVLIFGKFGVPALGIRGAAYGTIVGSVCALAVLGVAYFAKSNRKEFDVLGALKFDAAVMRKLLRFGYPAGVEMFLNLLAFSAMILTFHAHGLVTATATTIMFNWDMVSFLPLIGLEIGVMSLVGRVHGCRRSGYGPSRDHVGAEKRLGLFLGDPDPVRLLSGSPGGLLPTRGAGSGFRTSDSAGRLHDPVRIAVRDDRSGRGGVRGSASRSGRYVLGHVHFGQPALGSGATAVRDPARAGDDPREKPGPRWYPRS